MSTYFPRNGPRATPRPLSMLTSRIELDTGRLNGPIALLKVFARTLDSISAQAAREGVRADWGQVRVYPDGKVFVVEVPGRNDIVEGVAR